MALPSNMPGLPARAALGPDGLHVAVLDIPPGEMREPFLHETVQRLATPQSLVHVPMETLHRQSVSARPAGLIFHVARCGSTLVSQSLKQLDGVAVYSEPLAINELLLSTASRSRVDRVAALRSLGGFFARHAGGGPAILKLSSWNALFCDLIVEAFPGTPWAVCVRDPLEVCVSLQERSPSWLREDKANLFSDIADLRGVESTSIEERTTRFYAAFCQALGRLHPDRGLMLPYEGLPNCIWTALLPHFGLGASEQAQQAIARAAQTYSKSSTAQGAAFVPDGEAKRARASASLRSAVERLANPMHERLCATLTPSQAPGEGNASSS